MDAQIITAAICAEFEAGTIVEHDLEPHGISEMSIRYNGHQVEVSWYSGGDPARGDMCELTVDGGGLPISGGEARQILRAAQKRAAGLAAEVLAGLAKKP